MRDRWYVITKDSTGDDGIRHTSYLIGCETEDKAIRKRIEEFYKELLPTDEIIYGRGD